jgi:hypothetical protein
MLLAVMALVGCSEFERISENDTSRIPVRLYGVITSSADVTRGDGVISGSKPTSPLNLEVFRADQNSASAYETTYTEKLAGPNVLSSSGTISLQPTQYYLPDQNRKTKYVAVYPTGGVYSVGNRTLAYTLDGAMDIMCGSLVEGYRQGNETGIMNFNHLLTKLAVRVNVATGSDEEMRTISAMWGKVTTIRVQDRKTGVVLTLPPPGANNGTIGTLAVSGTKTDHLEFKKRNGTTVPEMAIPESDSSVEFGCLMLFPIVGEELILDIITTKGGTKSKGIGKVMDYKAGEIYNILVTFTLSDMDLQVKPGGGTLDEWSDSGIPEQKVELT